MRQIVVVSGKGGTGKTSVTGALAHLAKERLVLGDADVDAANLGLLLPGEEVLAEPFFAGEEAVVSKEKCTGCGRCEEVCRFDAIHVEGDTARASSALCEGCRACTVVCSEGAIELEPGRCGFVFRRETARGPLIHAALDPGRDNSGKLVTEVRKRATAAAQEAGVETVLLDGPPGIGCPVHAAVGGVSLALAVTEPSESGLHDLARLLELCGRFSVPAAVIVNKCDLDRAVAAKVRETARGHGAPVVAEIPFDGMVPRLLCGGGTMLDVPSAAIALEGMWARLYELSSPENRRTS